MKKSILTLYVLLIALAASAQFTITGPTNVIRGVEYDYILSAPSGFPGAPWVANGGTVIQVRNNREATIRWNSSGLQSVQVKAQTMVFASLNVHVSSPPSNWTFNNGVASFNGKVTTQQIETDQGTINGKLTITEKGNGASLLRFDTDRPWKFMQTNAGSLSNMVLRSEVDDKNFIIEAPNGTKNALFKVDNQASGNRVYLVQQGGRVGIGTASPDSKLTVNGKIHAKEVLVDTNISSVPDYVFEENYNLRSLEDTKSYIETNKHLPEVPSAAELAESGINLTDMVLILLKKNEELTLHMIEQNERIKELENGK